MKQIFKTSLLIGSSLLPAISFAQTGGFKDLIKSAGNVIHALIPIAAALSMVYFFWGLSKFVLHADSEDGREQGKQVMFWGIVALFVLVSIWGIISFLQGEVNVSNIMGLPI